MEVSKTHEEFVEFDPNLNEKSLRLLDVLKFSLLKFTLDGADKALKDRRTLKNHLHFSNGIALQEFHFGGDGSTSLVTNRVHGGNAFEGKTKGVRKSLQENEKYGNPLLNSSKNYRSRSEVVNFSSLDYYLFPMNFLAFIALSLMKIIGFQISLFFSFFTFPIWLSYACLMFVLFPLQTSKRVTGYSMKKLLGMWGFAHISVTSAVSKRVKAQKSIAVRIGFAFFKSICVFSMLIGLLASGFILGGFMMRKLVDKPIQTREILNFDYTKTSPVAFVPIMSSGVVKENLESQKHISTRTIPYNHKLQLTISLTVPESEYNQKLGVFQVFSSSSIYNSEILM